MPSLGTFTNALNRDLHITLPVISRLSQLLTSRGQLIVTQSYTQKASTSKVLLHTLLSMINREESQHRSPHRILYSKAPYQISQKFGHVCEYTQLRHIHNHEQISEISNKQNQSKEIKSSRAIKSRTHRQDFMHPLRPMMFTKSFHILVHVETSTLISHSSYYL